MKPDFEAVSNELSELINFGHVNCHVNKQLCDEQDITGYPILKFFENGTSKSRYRESFNPSLMKKYLTKMMSVPVEMRTPALINQIIATSQQRATIILLSPTMDPGFEAVANSFYSTTTFFVYCNTSEKNLYKDDSFIIMLDLLGVPEHLRPKSYEDQLKMHLIVSSSHSARYNIFYSQPNAGSTMNTDSASLTKWLSMMQFEFVPLFIKDVNEAVKKEGKRMVFGVINGTESDGVNKFLEELRRAALNHLSSTQYSSSYSFSYVDIQQLPYFLSYFSIKPKSFPSLFIHDFAQSESWVDEAQTEWNARNILSFVNKVYNGEMNSKEVEEQENDEAFNISEWIEDNKKIILIVLLVFACVASVIILIVLLKPQNKPTDVVTKSKIQKESTGSENTSPASKAKEKQKGKSKKDSLLAEKEE
eukprot:MONOS_6706.1-p1 / transcript=MONOS_6706.1 / gene=MONOS_6706 / organism=Monocercomonoides_exilis_PA203 / gene_product=Protein disulfide-isomerase, active site cysteins missing / transcript_product=Protein disulfide-isomerase, active site cysteins missing / location=Mono_scaffold00216:27993-29719(+) / protein_length=420 / sequence_SO=supercontig / SO=protein_coding / is_pseudo=false